MKTKLALKVEKGKKRVEEISQDERNKIREEERRKIMKEMKREKHATYSSHNSCKSLSEELRDYYEGRQGLCFKQKEKKIIKRKKKKRLTRYTTTSKSEGKKRNIEFK